MEQATSLNPLLLATATSGCFLMVASRGRSATTKCLAFMVTNVAVGFAPRALIRIKIRI